VNQSSGSEGKTFIHQIGEKEVAQMMSFIALIVAGTSLTFAAHVYEQNKKMEKRMKDLENKL
jgi:hypothetical protein